MKLKLWIGVAMFLVVPATAHAQMSIFPGSLPKNCTDQQVAKYDLATRKWVCGDVTGAGLGDVTASGTLALNAIALGNGTTVVKTTTTGTGVVTALGVNIGSAGAMVLFNGAGGTPSSLTLTNATGLPIAGIASLGTGIGTFLATPSSANLFAALTDETGSASGALAVFSKAPVINNLVASAPTDAISLAVRRNGASQTANLLEIQTEANALLASVDKTGVFVAPAFKTMGTTSGNVTIQSATGSWTLTLPTTAGTADYVLSTNGSGVTTWVAQTGGGGAVATDTIWDAAGDVVLGTGANTAARLAKGSAKDIFHRKSDGTTAEWASLATIASDLGLVDISTIVAGDLIVGSGAGTTTFLNKGSANAVVHVKADGTTLEEATTLAGLTLTSPTLTTPALGTPASGTLALSALYTWSAGVCQNTTASLGVNLPASNPATAVCKTGTNSNFAVAQFTATGQSFQINIPILDTVNTTTFNVKGQYMGETTSAGNTVFTLGWARVAAGSTLDPSFTDCTIMDAAGTANQLNNFTQSCTFTSLAAGDLLLLKFTFTTQPTTSGNQDLINFSILPIFSKAIGG